MRICWLSCGTLWLLKVLLSTDFPGTSIRPQTHTNCAACGADTTVPFIPIQGKPVLCGSCYQRRILAPAI
ncbi:MAG: CxxC-x17-CxxC domain-containing protein [Terracidiphilus sp.]